MNMSNKYDLYFAGPDVGIDLCGEIVDFGVELGTIKKGGAWYNIGDEKFQGRPAAVKYLRDNPDISEKIYGDILAKSI